MGGLTFNKDKKLLVHTSMINQEVEYYSTDSEELFRKNLKRHPKNWEWKNKKVRYKFNSLGYRSKEVTDVKRFILGFGCSFTEGVGLNEHEGWLYKYARKLGIEHLNFAKEATGMDIQYYNTLLWKQNKLPLPKLVVCQWPQKFRKSFGFESGTDIVLRDMSETNTKDGNWWGKRYIMDTGEMKMNALNWYLGMNNTWQSLGVPVLNFSWEPDICDQLAWTEFPCHFVDPRGVGSMQARDCAHDGEAFHDLTTKSLLRITNKI